jgi:hypothetical protein
MSDLGVTIVGESIPHLIYHFVCTFLNVETVSLCFSESDDRADGNTDRPSGQLPDDCRPEWRG